jgi:hypothetical protein
MAKNNSPEGSGDSTQFHVELGPHDLTDEEISGLTNDITRSIVDAVHRSARTEEAKRREPYVKITFVKQTGGPYQRAIHP